MRGRYLQDPESPGDPTSGNGNGDERQRRVPIEVLLSDAPLPGWYFLGSKKDVPAEACYVACYGDRYAWVMPEGVSALARFTVTVLSVVKFDPDKDAPRRGRGLTVTRE